MTTRSPATTRWIVAELRCGTRVILPANVTPPKGARASSTPTGPPTPHELASRALLAARCNCPPERWYIVVDLPPGAACDYADASEGVPAHESYGQAIRRKDGTWAQQPRGKRPVLLAWRGAEK